MRNLIITVTTTFILMTSNSFSTEINKTLNTIQIAALDQSCVAKCDAQKEQCFAQYTQSDSTHGTYVTPDGYKICWQTYHECKKNCER